MDRAASHTKWAGPLRKFAEDDPQEFLMEARSVLEMSNHSGFTFLMGLVDDRVEKLEAQQAADQRAFAEGKELSQAEHAHRAGEIAGLRSLSEFVQTALLIAQQTDEKQERHAAKLAAVGG